MVMVLDRTAALESVLARFFPGARRAFHDGRTRYGEQVDGGTLVAEFMQFVGADVIFGIPGGASLPLNDALTAAHVAGAFRYVLTGHEQGAAFEAEGYAAACGRAGFCTATSGPGATNLITGLADAYRDSRPVVAITGNAATTAEPEAFQAIDIAGITHGKATKASFRPKSPDEVQELLVRAYHNAVTGRPGSVLVDLPKDVQIKTAEMRPWEEFVAEYDWAPPEADEDALYAAARLLAGAERPVFCAGHGVILSGAAEELRALSRKLQIPVATTVHGLGAMPAGDPLSLGMLGMHGTMVANIAPYLSDVTVAIGARFDDRVIGARPNAFAPNARVIHIDVDKRQLNRVRAADIAIHGGVKSTLQRLLELMDEFEPVDRTAWLAQLAEIGEAMPTPSYDDPPTQTLTHEFVYQELSAALQERDRSGEGDVVATFDVGTHQMKGAQWFRVSRPRSFITSGGMGSMGCAVPMAVGAWFARPEATVVAAVGDGGFVMSSHELDTIGSYQLPIKILLFDDSALGMVTNWHGLYFGGRDMTSDRRRGRAPVPLRLPELKTALQGRIAGAGTPNELVAALCDATVQLSGAEWPLFAATAASYGIPAERVHTKAQLREAVRRMLTTPGPYLVQVMLPAKVQVFPLMEPGTTPQDMAWKETFAGSNVRVYARERFDYEARRLRSVGSVDRKACGPVELDPSVV
ncbi:MAG: acetolactate synthase large subunit [Chloroflexi bacterium]|nr:acetolactate synthase large subunit [Chloroflexota bacterium]